METPRGQGARTAGPYGLSQGLQVVPCRKREASGTSEQRRRLVHSAEGPIGDTGVTGRPLKRPRQGHSCSGGNLDRACTGLTSRDRNRAVPRVEPSVRGCGVSGVRQTSGQIRPFVWTSGEGSAPLVARIQMAPNKAFQDQTVTVNVAEKSHKTEN